MTVTTPRSPETDHDRDLERRVSDLEALIEEARQRARRRRRRNGACILLAILAGGGLYFGLDRGGASPVAAPASRASGGNAAPAAGNSGKRWGPSLGPDGGPAFAVAVAPSAPQVVYLGTKRGVFRSTNGGRRWSRAGLAKATALASPQYEPVSGVTSLVVDPRAPTRLYAGLNGRWVGGMTYRESVYESTDGGKSWRALGLRGQPIAINPTGPPTVFAATGGPGGTSRLVRSTDGGRRWQQADRGLPSTYLWGLAFDPATPRIVYAAMGTHVFESTDGGGRWHPLGIPRRYVDLTAVAVDPVHPRTVYVAADSGVVVSPDGGRSWRMLSATMGAHGRDRGYGQVTALLVDPRDSHTLYATTFCAGVFTSTDTGHTWRPANAGLHPGCSSNYPLALDPRAPRTIYAAEPARGVLKTVDGGTDWRVANRGLSLTTVSSLAVDPTNPRVVYAGTRSPGLFESVDGGVHWERPHGPGLGLVVGVAVDPSAPRNVLVAAPPNGIVRSADAGRTWTGTASGANLATVVAISGRTAYAGAAGSLFGSTDGGRTWRPLGHLGAFVQALAIVPGDPAVVYAGIGGAGASTVGGLYRSTDGGNSWQRLTTGLNADVTTILLAPRTPATVYIGTSEGTVFRSMDGGSTWQPADTGLETTGSGVSGVTALALDPVHPATLYAAIGSRGVFRSTDAGASWHTLDAGLNDRDVTALTLDATGRTLYAGTGGGGVVKLHRNP